MIPIQIVRFTFFLNDYGSTREGCSLKEGVTQGRYPTGQNFEHCARDYIRYHAERSPQPFLWKGGNI